MVLRLGSMLAGLVLIVLMMQYAQSPQMEMRLAMLLEADAAPSDPEAQAIQRRAAEEWQARLDRELLESIDDETPFRNEEAPAWFHLFELARQTSPDELREASAGMITYAQLMQQSDFYRARVVTVRGIAHRIDQIQAAENDHGIETIYLVWIQPGGTDRLPFQFCCLELPPGFAVGELKRSVRADGVFFKNRIYRHSEGLSKCPVLIGNTFDDLSPVEPQVAEDRPSLLSPGATIGLGVMLAVALVLLIRRAAFSPTLTRGDVPPPELVAEELRQLESAAPDLPHESDA